MSSWSKRTRVAFLLLVVVYASAASAQTASPSNAGDVCAVSEAFASWHTDAATAALMKPVADLFGGAIAHLCSTQPSDETFRAGNGTVWLVQADGVARALADELLAQLSKPQTRTAILRERRLAAQVLAMQAALGPPRSLAFGAVREVPREVIRTVEVEVPARCPVVEAPPPPRDACADALRQGADRWATQLYKWTDWYRGSGADWSLADNSKSQLRNIANGHGDPRSYVIGWLAQWRSIRRQDDTSFLGSGPMPQVAADMRAQLSSCGIYQEGDR